MQTFNDIKISLSSCIITFKNENFKFYSKINEIYEGNTILKNKLNQRYINDLITLNEALIISFTMVNRSKMKCAFFGKTSNGKSAVINAMLGEEVLPSCVGRTTSCFITVQGCKETDGYFYNKNDMKMSLCNLENVASELEEGQYDMDSAIKLFWPIHRCELLENDIELLDSPGVDFSLHNDTWINTYCKDADVFVYVVDGRSTICESEKRFFREVKSQIGNPNLFVLFNKWDTCEENSDTVKLRKQHLETIQKFLEDINIVYDQDRKIFFVSALKSLREPTVEFEAFVRSLSRDITQCAVVTKFKRHAEKGKEGIDKVTKVIGTIMDLKNWDCSNDIPINIFIENLIENTFGRIEMDALDEMDKNCRSCASSMSRSIERGRSSCDLISIMIDSQFDLLIQNLKKNIGMILPCVRNSLKSFAPVKIDDDLMNNYVPNSFEELVKKYQGKLSKGKANEDIESAYNELSEYIRPPDSHQQLKKSMATYGTILGFGWFAIKSMFNFISDTVTSIVTSTTDLFERENRRPELEAHLGDKIFKYLERVVKDIVNESRIDIEERIGCMTDIFVTDCEEVRRLMEYLEELREKMNTITEDMDFVGVRISSMVE